MIQRLYRSIWNFRNKLPVITSPWMTMLIYGVLLIAIGASGPTMGVWMSRINERDGIWVWFVIGTAYGHAKWWGAKTRSKGVG